MKSSFARRPRALLAFTLTAAFAAAGWLGGQSASYVNFEAAQTRPVCLSPDGRRLFVVNTPDARLSIFDVSSPASATPVLLREIPVGLEPVSVNALSNDDVWVVNQISGSVSVVSVATGAITDTLPCPTEPADVVFAGGKAFVSCSGANTIRVFDVATHAPLASIPLDGLHPRSLAVSADAAKVYAAIAFSGNRSTLLPPNLAPAPPLPTNLALPPAPQVSLIVGADDSRLQPKPNLPDNDLAVIDAATSTVTRYFQGVGTINFFVAVRPGSPELWVANTEARNLLRFEPTLKGHAVDNRVTRVDPTGNGTVTAFDLNPGIDYAVFPNPAARATALAQPTALAFEPNGAAFWVTSFGTDRVARVNAATGAVMTRVETGPTTDGSANPAAKKGPRGLAYQASTGRLYVSNRLSNSVSVVSASSASVVAEVPAGSYDPTPNAVRLGRGFLYDARLSGNGTQSCASCHIDGHRDELAWDLGDPGGQMLTVASQPVGSPFPLNVQMHPMKGPMTTQTLRGLLGLEPLHWRGDRADFTQFNGAFASLLGGTILSDADMGAFRDFVNTIVMPANPNLNLDRTMPATFPPGDPNAGNTAAGQNTYLNEPYVAGQRCNTCHLLPTGSNRTIIPSIALQESQSFKVPQLREIFAKKFFVKSPTAVSLSGFGLTHDGVDPDLFTFLSRPVFGSFSNDTARKRNLSAFVMCLDTGTAPATGYARSIRSATLGAATADWSVLEAQAASGNINLIARAQFSGNNHGLLYRPASNDYLSDQSGLGPFSRAQLQTMITAGTVTLTLVGVPPGSGSRMAIDRNSVNAPPATFAEWQNGRFTAAELLDPSISGANADPDGDGEDNLSEFRTFSDPKNGGSVVRTGRAINISTRLRAQTGDNVLIGGFVITGTEPKKVIVRAVGPSLAAAGVTGALADPTLEIFGASGPALATNDNWRDAQQAEIQASGFAPTDDREAAIVRTLAPGIYTAIVRGAGATTGVALVEVYDLATTSESELANVSTRGRVETGDNVMIGGFVVGAGLGTNESGTVRVLVRAIGPSLAQAGLANPLADPVLELHDVTGAVIASNDNWADTQQAAIQATGLAPGNSAESALLITLPKGVYTALVRGKNGGTGVALVEVYKVP